MAPAHGLVLFSPATCLVRPLLLSQRAARLPVLHPSPCPAPPCPCRPQDVAAAWGDYALMQQQDMFNAMQLPVSNGDWDQLQERLQVALELASLF